MSAHEKRINDAQPCRFDSLENWSSPRTWILRIIEIDSYRKSINVRWTITLSIVSIGFVATGNIENRIVFTRQKNEMTVPAVLDEWKWLKKKNTMDRILWMGIGHFTRLLCQRCMWRTRIPRYVMWIMWLRNKRLVIECKATTWHEWQSGSKNISTYVRNGTAQQGIWPWVHDIW